MRGLQSADTPDVREGHLRLDDTTIANLVHNLLVNWNRSLSVLASTLLVFLAAVINNSDFVMLFGVRIGVENFMSAITVLYTISSLYVIHILSSLSKVFGTLEDEYKDLFQFFIGNEGGVFNAFGMNWTGAVPAIPFGMLVALLMTVTLDYGLSIDIFLVPRILMEFILPVIANFGLPIFDFLPEAAVSTDEVYEKFTTLLWIILYAWMFFLFLFTLFRLVKTMNVILGHGSWSRYKRPGNVFLVTVVVTTFVSIFFIFMVTDGRSGNGTTIQFATAADVSNSSSQGPVISTLRLKGNSSYHVSTMGRFLPSRGLGSGADLRALRIQ